VSYSPLRRAQAWLEIAGAATPAPSASWSDLAEDVRQAFEAEEPREPKRSPNQARRGRPADGTPHLRGWMVYGNGDRQPECLHYEPLCFEEAGRRDGPSRCPPGCRAFVPADRSSERDHLAMSRRPTTAALGGGGWRAPGRSEP
jgi:hypothetical protein